MPIVGGSEDEKARLWDVETKKGCRRMDRAHWPCVISVLECKWQVNMSESWDGTARVWDVKSGETVSGPIKTGHEHVWAVIYSPDNIKIATGGYNESVVKIWDAKMGELLKHDQAAWSLAQWLARPHSFALDLSPRLVLREALVSTKYKCFLQENFEHSSKVSSEDGR
ncbi:hypothetical protein CY34DRAFT_490011 [Suillus luteus UH-Slu-Lm8-n1]|uniref:Uncharacterized protein n=1 Tax=Suillus luteus UH-Slu-Lm8-n1 TaxID=930992 RepID=A0A0C9ZHI7_9AGAM|nr:hypothetical protein CY34DRAFT_490011 [Suillus luteus UH-Slu-Lm8-n1]